GPGARLDDRGDEGGEFRRRPTAILRELGVDEVEAVEGVRRVLDAAVHVDAALLAGVTLDGGGGVDHLELAGVRRDGELVAPDDRDLREQGAGRFPAFRAAADMVERALPGHRHLDGVLLALAGKRAAGEVLRAGLDAVIDGGVNRNRAGHGRVTPLIDGPIPRGGAARGSSFKSG